ncbi:MAG: ACT domain-containing protein [Candidatus Diapherotrites archaeon]|nr:ACT domain-containing protein [Candidatus Diapherotrites archaeon]
MNTQTVKLDSKGRIIIPNSFRESLGIKISENIVIELDKENERMIVFPIQKNVKKMEIKFGDQPGALAKAANILAKHKVDLVYSESRSSKRGKEAVWIVVADFSQSNMEKLKQELAKERFK